MKKKKDKDKDRKEMRKKARGLHTRQTDWQRQNHSLLRQSHLIAVLYPRTV
jgi:hypothetical protein